MAIVNRDLDASEQRKTLQAVFNQAIGISSQLLLAQVPVASELQAIRVAALGLSGSPLLNFTINRFIAGAGQTIVTGGATQLTVTAYGTSGLQSVAVNASGNSLVQLQAGDIVQVITSGANTAMTNLSVALVVKELVDIKNQYNAF